jgi:Zn-dependent M28 family amino/carboxypeptidase
MAEILADADNNRPLPHFAIPGAIRAHVQLKTSKVESQNVAGLLPGTDPKLKNEYVVLSAHLDHVGVGEPINGDKIYNGAMDDASGIASDLEIARMLHDSNAKLRRSVLILAVTGEEKGLQGSRYFAAHPTVNGKSIVADINMDMFLPLFPLKYLEVQGLGESTLGDDIRTVAKAAAVEVQADKEPERNRFIRSDQYSFIRRGIPSLAFKFGFIPGSPEDKIFKDWLHDRYHAPSDDLNQPVDKPAAAQFNRIILALTERVANADARPEWKPDSFFRRFAGE